MRSVRVLWVAICLLLATVIVLAVLLVRSGAQTPQIAEPPSANPEGAGTGESPSKAVAVVGGHTITADQLQQRLADKYGAELLNVLVDREAIRQEAEALGITVGREEIDAEMKRMQEGYENEQQFYKSMKEQLGLSKSELNEDVYYKLLLEGVALRGVQVTDAEVDDYIKAHPEEFKGYVQYYLMKMEVKTKEEAAQFIKDVQNGADFSSLARKSSIDTATAKLGGDLGWVEENDRFVSSALLDAARVLKPNEISKPIPLKSSFAVIWLKDKKEVKKTVDDRKRAYIRKELGLQKAPPQKLLVQSMREKRHAEIIDPELR
ncbi:peptidylprolyl isomerase [Paenibacillus ginsengarvi]|uniref:peptidylprolyl isomerase n=1 Tax=Paenibacillus ginsengarvi TaxID=400777 RepID=A0A3B0AZS9_9BACL|nr:peptidylprolyl isomerase [Paenibacillus ginsengarvi]RKN65771.1 peptidylprolyl isomerase [Paenibacillus ginsengarvi]